MRVRFSSLVFAAVLLGSSQAEDSAPEFEQHHHLRAIQARQWEPRIVGGQDATKGEYPFFVQGDGCGASLIWKDIVLTAAHCQGHIGNWRGRVLVGASEYNVEVS